MRSRALRSRHSFPTRRSSDLDLINESFGPDTTISMNVAAKQAGNPEFMRPFAEALEATGFPTRFLIEVTEDARSEEHTSELQSRFDLVCRLLLEKKKSLLELC